MIHHAEGELAPECQECVGSPRQPGFHHDLGVALGAQRVSLVGQVLAQRGVIEDLAVVAERVVARGGGPRLTSAVAIDDLEP